MQPTNPNLPRVIDDCHELLKWLIPVLDKFPRSRRFTLGERLESGLLAVLDLLYRIMDNGPGRDVRAHNAGRKTGPRRVADVKVSAVEQHWIGAADSLSDSGAATVFKFECAKNSAILTRKQSAVYFLQGSMEVTSCLQFQSSLLNV